MILRRFYPLSCLFIKKSTCRHIHAWTRQRIKSPEYYHMICFGISKCTSEKGLLQRCCMIVSSFPSNKVRLVNQMRCRIEHCRIKSKQERDRLSSNSTRVPMHNQYRRSNHVVIVESARARIIEMVIASYTEVCIVHSLQSTRKRGRFDFDCPKYLHSSFYRDIFVLKSQGCSRRFLMQSKKLKLKLWLKKMDVHSYDKYYIDWSNFCARAHTVERNCLQPSKDCVTLLASLWRFGEH